MRTVVTGAEGFVGGFMVAELVGAGHDTVAFVRDPQAWAGRRKGPGVAIPDNLEVVPADVTDRSVLTAAIRRSRPEGLIHLAAQASPSSSWADPSDTYRTNILGTSHVLDAAAAHAPRVLLVGSAHQYRARPDGMALTESDAMEASSPYALSKIVQEKMGLLQHARHGLPVVAARAFNHTGPGQSAAYAVGSFAHQLAFLQAKNGGRIRVGNLQAERDFLDVRDVVRAYRILLEEGSAGEAYNVCSGRAVPLAEVLNSIIGIAGLQGKVVIEAPSAPAAPDVLVGDPAKLREGLGWVPGITLRQALADTFSSYGGVCEEGAVESG